MEQNIWNFLLFKFKFWLHCCVQGNFFPSKCPPLARMHFPQCFCRCLTARLTILFGTSWWANWILSPNSLMSTGGSCASYTSFWFFFSYGNLAPTFQKQINICQIKVKIFSPWGMATRKNPVVIGLDCWQPSLGILFSPICQTKCYFQKRPGGDPWMHCWYGRWLRPEIFVYITLHSITLHYITFNYITCITLHIITLHALHHILFDYMHYITTLVPECPFLQSMRDPRSSRCSRHLQ